jgi:UDP-glucose 4-epimerase
MRALVTGGAGFIGSHLADSLLAQGADVVILDDLSNGKADNVPAAARLLTGSVLEDTDLHDAMQTCETVFHLAADVSVVGSVTNPISNFECNANGTLRVLEAAKRHGVSCFIYSSSSAVYGDTANQPASETAMTKPCSVYGAAKASGEQLVAAYARSYGMKCVSLRYFNVFGPRQRADSAYAAVIPTFIARLFAGEPLTVYGDGAQTRDFTYVSNIVEANIAAMDYKGINGDTINIATGNSISIIDLIEEISRQTGIEPKVVYAPRRSGEILHSSADVSLSRSTLRYTPSVDWKEGLKKTIQVLHP